MDAVVEILHFSGVTAVRAGQLFKKLIVLSALVFQAGDHIIQKAQSQQCGMNRNSPDAGGVFDFLLALLVGFYPQTGKTVYHANIIQIQLADFIQTHSLIQSDQGNPVTHWIKFFPEMRLFRHLCDVCEDCLQLLEFKWRTLFCQIGKFHFFHQSPCRVGCHISARNTPVEEG